ncbi:methyltransferase domain-containing protein [Exilibacterium tricleocarpae]|uniref:Methyltransferase domain-containing protein n=1 Tax=Exilibacterium tricleocarpae TaxID=2591008 RepID=A0A545TNG6_9GAMM|nr:class I SAM-dependent methyltransferase [Exilibacterium tricleocarpae]TQV78767.1 methyltransferase domain-containing protein [Exilibacterium tricleocarpae]
MKTVEESVVMAMDGADSNLFPYLPYILQDLWEIGASPEVVLKLVEKYTTDRSNLKVLDLGCGKGAVLIKLAKQFNCYCHGVDAVEEFIDEAKDKAKKFNVDENCCFECDDIRVRINDLRDYDIIILGAIGPVLGDYQSTLTKASKCIKESGLVFVDDGYIDDGSEYSHPLMEKKSVILKQASDAGMKLIDEVVVNTDEIKESDEYIYRNIKRRCQELIEKHPDKKNIFIDYIREQEEENEALETKVVCSTMLFGRCS